MIMAKLKVLVLIDQMQTGGAGRVTSTLLPGLLQKGYEVVMALDNANCQTFYPIPDEVRQMTIHIKSHDKSGIKQLRIIRAARRIIKQERPDVVIAVTFFPFFYAHYATIGLDVPIICYDHTSFGRNMGHFINWIRYSLYGKADKLVILTQKDEKLLGNKFPRKVVVYNPLTYPIGRHTIERQKTILCAGRIDAWKVKGFDRMIEMWSHLAPKHPGWRLQIAGEGSSKNIYKLKEIAAVFGVKDYIDFLGQVYDMPSLYSVASIFALPSRVEGFPMVLLEAMSQGCVCCSFEMGGAVNEMMSNTSGSIVKDGELVEFEKQLEKLMEQYPHFDALQESGYKDACRFSCEHFYNQWDKIIQEVIKK